MDKKWWKESVVYQIYPKSFYDTNGDGIGDIKGIIKKLPYLKFLGVDVLWLCPVYDSPNADNGYDVRDYQAVMKEFGTMEDLDNLLCEAHKKGIKIIMDLVVNHTSDEHRWFVESRKSKDNRYSDYYIWKDGKNGREPNNWQACFGGSTWTLDKSREMYYMHLFHEKQPDLNWTNPNVRDDIYKMMRWWLDKGIDGFRLDAINYLSKDPDFADGETTDGQRYAPCWKYCANGTHMHEFLKEMNKKVLSDYDIMTVGEMSGTTVDDAVKYAGYDSGELNMIFQFQHIDIGFDKYGKWTEKRFPFDEFREGICNWQTKLYNKAWNSVFLGNHDQPRCVSRFGNDTAYRAESAKMLATLLLTLGGTPYIFQGDEIGMTNVQFDNIEDYRDIETYNIYNQFVENNPSSKDEVLRYIHCRGRDNARTPVQWDSSKNAGFTTGTPWIKVNPNFNDINVEAEMNDNNSILNFYRKMIVLRKQYKTFIYGEFSEIKAKTDNVFCYERYDSENKFIVLLNFSDQQKNITVDDSLKIESLLIGNYADEGENIGILRPYEAKVYRVLQK